MQRDTILSVSINKLIPNKYQPRSNFDEKALNELSKSIKEHGILNPILVRIKEDKYEIIAGERRYRAAKSIGLTEVPVIIKDIKEEDLAELALIENLHRENLNPIEEAKSYEEIMKLSNMTQQSLGEKLGKSQSFIANKLRLLSLPNKIQEALINKRISERHARSLMRITDEKRQQELLEKVINEKLTVKDLDIIINEKEITETEIKAAIEDIMKSLNIPVEKDKKEEKESDNMNGNFFPNYNNQMGVNENASLNSMNMQSMNTTPLPQAPEMVMPTPSVPQMPEVLPEVNQQPVQPPIMTGMLDTPLFTPQFENIPNEQPILNNGNEFTTNIPNQMDSQPIETILPLNQPEIPVIEELPKPVMPQAPEMVMPTPSAPQMPEVLPEINQPTGEEPTMPTMMDTPLFTPQFEQPQMIEQVEPIIMPQATNPIIDNSPSLYEVPVNVPPINENIFEEDKLTKVTEFLNQNGIAFKSYSNETNHCIIIEL